MRSGEGGNRRDGIGEKKIALGRKIWLGHLSKGFSFLVVLIAFRRMKTQSIFLCDILLDIIRSFPHCQAPSTHSLPFPFLR